MGIKKLFSMLLGICETQPPQEAACWKLSGGKVEIDLKRSPELSTQGGAVRLEGGDLPKKILVVHGKDGELHAFTNKCTHGGRRLDPLKGESLIRCCSVGKSTFDYEGKAVSGSAKDPITVLESEKEGEKLIIRIK